jgi:hypothetical protein
MTIAAKMQERLPVVLEFVRKSDGRERQKKNVQETHGASDHCKPGACG